MTMLNTTLAAYNITELSEKPRIYSNTFFYIKIIIVVLILSNNAFVFYLIYRNRLLIKNPYTRLLLSLSICDFLSGIVILGRTISTVVESNNDYLPHLTKYLIINDMMTTFLVKTAAMHLCGITLDRFISIFYALRYKAIVTLGSLSRYIIFAWTFPFLAAGVQMTWLYEYFIDDNTPDDIDELTQIEIWYSVIAFTIFLFVPLVLLGVAYILMFIEIRKIIFRPQPSFRKKNESTVYSKQRRVLYTFTAMYLLFAFLTTPYFSLRVIIDWNNLHRFVYVSNLTYNLASLLKSSVSFINPILYMTTNRDFRLTIKRLLPRSKKQFQYNIKRLSLSTSVRRSWLTSSINEDSGVYDSPELHGNYRNNNNLVIPSSQSLLKSYKPINDHHHVHSEQIELSKM